MGLGREMPSKKSECTMSWVGRAGQRSGRKSDSTGPAESKGKRASRMQLTIVLE